MQNTVLLNRKNAALGRPTKNGRARRDNLATVTILKHCPETRNTAPYVQKKAVILSQGSICLLAWSRDRHLDEEERVESGMR